MRGMRFAAVLFAISTLLALIFYLSIGYYYSYIDHDEHVVYFVKRSPTFRGEFINPFANEGDSLPVNELSSAVREELSDYCKYAYGISSNDEKSLEGCRAQIIREVQ